MTTAYSRLTEQFGRASHIRGALRVLGWDASVNMPTGGASARADQSATLSGILHGLTTEPQIGDWLDETEASNDLNDWQRANVREMRRTYTHATSTPAETVDALSRASSETEMAWRSARADNDFAALAPKLENQLAIVREWAQVKGDALGLAPYDAMLDMYDPGRRAAQVDGLFADLADWLPDMLEEILERQVGEPPATAPPGPFSDEEQYALGLMIMEAMGFDFDHGRLDVSAHPFTGGVPDDLRLTTRYSPDDFTSSVMAVVHETGHALYERGLPADWRGQAVGRSRGMTVHESQSLIMEMQASRHPAFITWLAPVAAKALKGQGAAWDADNMIRLYSRVARSPIRVDADEVTYPLHVILRYELERAMIAGDLTIADLPGAWNDGMERLVGYRPKNDAEGCLQDIHWPSGSFGYFPTYTLGRLLAAQLWETAVEQHSDIPQALGNGDFGPLLGWLRTNVHAKGCLHSPDDLITDATGGSLDTGAFKRHVTARYLNGEG